MVRVRVRDRVRVRVRVRDRVRVRVRFNDTATTEIYTMYCSSAASDVYKRQHPDCLVVWKLSMNSLLFSQKEIQSNRVLSLIHISEPTRRG